jgi:hypothetical protein
MLKRYILLESKFIQAKVNSVKLKRVKVAPNQLLCSN